MSFNPNIPQSSDIPSQSQGQILTNFQQLNTVFDVDHVPFNDATAVNRGKHDQSTYIELSVDPATLADEVSFYSKDSGGNSRLFMRQESSGTVIQMSGEDPVNAASSGSTFLAGGLIYAWNRETVSNNTTVTVSAVTNIHQVVLTIEDASATPMSRVYVFSVAGNTFRTKVPTGGSAVIRWMVVGN